MAAPSAKDRFREVVCGIPQTTLSAGVNDVNRQLIESFLSYGSATEDNSNCVERVRVGVARESDAGPVAGLITVDSGTLLSDVFNALEDAEIPDAVRRAFPSLSPVEWSACTRMVTMILTALETESPAPT